MQVGGEMEKEGEIVKIKKRISSTFERKFQRYSLPQRSRGKGTRKSKFPIEMHVSSFPSFPPSPSDICGRRFLPLSRTYFALFLFPSLAKREIKVFLDLGGEK